MSELPAHDRQYPFGLTTDDLIHVGAAAGDDELCEVCGYETGICDCVCGTCDSRVTGSYQILCADCASLNQQSEEATRSRMRKICVALEEALDALRGWRTAEGISILAAARLDHIPETIRRQAATPPGVKV